MITLFYFLLYSVLLYFKTRFLWVTADLVGQ